MKLEGQQVCDHSVYTLKQVVGLSLVTIRNYLSQFMAWCEEQGEQSFTLQAISTYLLTRYRTHLQITLWLKPSTVNRTLMSLKRRFALATKTQAIEYDPTIIVKFVVSKEAVSSEYLCDEAEVMPLHQLVQIRSRDSLDTTMLYIRGTRQDLQDVEKIV